MKRLLVALALAALCGAAGAACFSRMIIGPNGDSVVCTTCCDANGFCVTTCL